MPAKPTSDRWSLAGDRAILWPVRAGDPHRDRVEMSGRKVSAIVDYGVDAKRRLSVGRHVVWPALRFEPNRTRDHLALEFGIEIGPTLLVNGSEEEELAERVRFDGLLRIEGTVGESGALAFTRTVFPSTDKRAVLDRTTLTNRSENPVPVAMGVVGATLASFSRLGIHGAYTAEAKLLGGGARVLKPGESADFTVILCARIGAEPLPHIDPSAEEAARRRRVLGLHARLRLATPEPMLDTAFSLAKIRAAESIFETRGGLMHSPGGGPYYAAIWANDEAEYANPFFAYLGDSAAIEAARNSFRHFAQHMNPEFRPIPSAINAEGAGSWQGAGDRGDMAMIAYGAGRFALALGGAEAAQELWPLVEWCLEYCRRKLTADGVIASDSDELEGRFPAGTANLCTSVLAYDALRSAAMLGRQLGRPGAQIGGYEAQADGLREAIEKHFGAEVEGFRTYRYYAGNTVLRAWIGGPLAMGIFDRAEGTIDALFHSRLWTEDGLATQAGAADFWDRSTLYALRGGLAAGATEAAMERLRRYTRRRLLGDHVPYPVESHPEGDQRHLSAESALYCRVFVEGLFGFRPTGFGKFTCAPRLPSGWPAMALERISVAGRPVDLVVNRSGSALRVEVRRPDRAPLVAEVAGGGTLAVDLSNP